jgi:hypothetical protein
MKSARKTPTAAKFRSWRVSIIRKRGQYLGAVEAPYLGSLGGRAMTAEIWEYQNDALIAKASASALLR